MPHDFKPRITDTISADPLRLSRGRPHIIVNKPAPSLEELRWQPFRDHVARLQGAPGEPLSGIEKAGPGFRVRYQNGSIDQRPDGGTAWVYGAIGERYEQLGSSLSWLGMPITDEMSFPEEGRVSVFERGTIYWWGDVGAIDINEVVVHYTGLICFGETDSDQLSSEDEPYVLLGVVAPTVTNETRTQVYDEVNDGQSRPDLIELYRGRPNGLVLAIRLMEHDFGNPDQYRAEVAGFVGEAFDAIAAGASQIPYVGPVLAATVPMLKKPMTEFLNATLHTQDDHLGAAVIPLTPKQMVVLAVRTPMSSHLGVGFKVETPVLGGGEGATYKVYFGLGAV
jgi:hypothetical protein